MNDAQPVPTPVKRSSFVTDEFMKITPSLVRELGGDMAGAGVLVMIEYRARIFGVNHDGYRWWTVNRAELAHDTGLSPRQIDGAVERLVKKGRIVKQKLGRRRSDHTMSYRILYDDGGSMPSAYIAANADLPDPGDEANTHVPDPGDEANTHVTDRGHHDVPDRGDHDVPDRGDLLLVQEGEEGEEAPLPLMDRCAEHATVLIPPSCGGCAAVRKTREQVEAQALAARQEAERQRAAALRQGQEKRVRDQALDIEMCSLCDDDGRVNGLGLCLHDPQHEEDLAKGIAGLREQLRAKGLPETARTPVLA